MDPMKVIYTLVPNLHSDVPSGNGCAPVFRRDVLTSRTYVMVNQSAQTVQMKGKIVI